MCNGLLWPDRTPHPAAYEVKALQAPLGMRLEAAGGRATAAAGGGSGAEEVRVVLRNKQHFSSSAGLALSWRLLADGVPAGGGWRALQLQQALGPQQEVAVGLGATWDELAQRVQGAAEAALEVRAEVRCCCHRRRPSSFADACATLFLRPTCPPHRALPRPPALQLAGDALWAPAGHEVQTVQLDLPSLCAAAQGAQGQPAPAAAPPQTAQDGGGSITVTGGSGQGWSMRFDSATASLTAWTDAQGQQLLAAPLAPCFYRAPTDNDKGGSGGSSYAARRARRSGRAASVPGAAPARARCCPLNLVCLPPCRCRWKAAGLDRLEVAPGSASLTFEAQPGSGHLLVRSAFLLRPAERQQEEAAAEVEEGVGVGEVRRRGPCSLPPVHAWSQRRLAPAC